MRHAGNTLAKIKDIRQKLNHKAKATIQRLNHLEETTIKNLTIKKKLQLKASPWKKLQHT